MLDERYLIGKLIKTLANNQETVQLINSLSQEVTDKIFTNKFGSEELVKSLCSLSLFVIDSLVLCG